LPSRKVHEALDRVFLGRKFTQVHRLIDLPARNMGRKHRALFHDPLSAPHSSGQPLHGAEEAEEVLLSPAVECSAVSALELVAALVHAPASDLLALATAHGPGLRIYLSGRARER